MQVCVNCSGVNCTSECRPVSGNNPYRISNTVSGENYTVNLTLVNGIGYSEVSNSSEIGEARLCMYVCIHIHIEQGMQTGVPSLCYNG